MPNRLANESSPYLRQHADNPVEWYPWGSEALDLARAEDRPILLSIGYAACHWCHVMAHESFEDEATARVMNEHFVNVKVDREERPDVDAIYMQAVQAMTGHGGWPMTVFLTPAGEPFYGGTYFPPEDRHGIPSFRKILEAVAASYRTRRDAVTESAARMRELYRSTELRSAAADSNLTPRTLELAFRSLARQYDARFGGFASAPKFPPTMALDFLLRYWKHTGTQHALEMAHDTFIRMGRGGMYDQIGGGFARYSVDAEWLVPHFEKMLYDNALLMRFGAHLWQATGDLEVRRVTEETVDWLSREMTSPEGGFYSSLDADSEGHEGKFYVWDESELDVLLGSDAAAVKLYYGVTSSGNFEGKNILHVASDPSVTAARLGISVSALDGIIAGAKRTLYAARASRVWPGRDDKILAGWNGLMLRGVAEAARVFGRADFREMAVKNAAFLWSALVLDGRVLRSYRDGQAKIPGFLEDHAALALGFVTVYQLTFERVWLDRALELGSAITRWFRDENTGRLFDTASDAEQLITRPRDVTDNAVPSGNSLAAELFLLLAEYSGDTELRAYGDAIAGSLAGSMAQYPTAFGHLLGVADQVVNGAVEVALVGDPAAADFQRLVAAVAGEYVPSLVLTGGEPRAAGDDALPLLSGRDTVGGKAAAYVCRGYVCDAPVTDAVELGRQLGRWSAGPVRVAQ